MSKVPTPDNPIPIEEQTKIITLDGSEDWLVMSKADKIKELEKHITYYTDYLGYVRGETGIEELPSQQEIFDKINEIIRYINQEEIQ